MMSKSILGEDDFSKSFSVLMFSLENVLECRDENQVESGTGGCCGFYLYAD